MFDFDITKPWQVLEMTTPEFLIGMASLGKYQDINLVGSFAEPGDRSVRTAHRDIDLPFHRDGIYTESIANMQDGMYIASPNVDIVGMYCLRSNSAGDCWTILSEDEAGKGIITEVNLKAGQALIWDNRLWHGRRGPVGDRLLIRFWTTCPALYEARP